jgi:hypothetical protein
MEMMLANSSTSYGRMGVRLYDALGVGNGENDRAIDDFCILKMPFEKIKNYAGLDAKSPEELRRQAAQLVFRCIAEDYVGKFPPIANGHPNLGTTKFAVAHTVVRDFVDRFASAVTDDDFAKLAEDFKAQLAQQFERVNTTLKNIDIAKEQAKGELEGKLQQIADQYGIQLTQGIKDMFARTLVEATGKMLKDAHSVEKALSVRMPQSFLPFSSRSLTHLIPVLAPTARFRARPMASAVKPVRGSSASGGSDGLSRADR